MELAPWWAVFWCTKNTHLRGMLGVAGFAMMFTGSRVDISCMNTLFIPLSVAFESQYIMATKSLS